MNARVEQAVTAVTVTEPVDGTGPVSDGRPGPRARRKRPGSGPVARTQAVPAVVREAWRLAGGDPARLVVQPDGSILVVNNPRRGLGRP